MRSRAGLGKYRVLCIIPPGRVPEEAAILRDTKHLLDVLFLRNDGRLSRRAHRLIVVLLYNALIPHLLPDKSDHRRTLATKGGQKGQKTDKSGKSRTNATYRRSNGPFRLTVFRSMLLFTVRTIARPFFYVRKPAGRDYTNFFTENHFIW